MDNMALKLNPTSNITKLIIVVELILVIYLLNTLTISVYKGYQIDQVIKEFEAENARISQENKQKSEDYDYFTSQNYIEKIAKQNLGLVKQGEEVIVLPLSKSNQSETADKSTSSQSDFLDLNNSQKWWVFFFDRK
jgi:cell division protein FtsB